MDDETTRQEATMSNMRQARKATWAGRAVAALLLATGVAAVPGSASAQDGGFLMLGADAAYASFEGAAPADDNCYVSVGYVRAAVVFYFGGDVVRPHSDLEVRFDDCGALTGAVGVVPMVGNPAGSMVRLESAAVDQVDVPIEVPGSSSFAGSVNAIVDLEWTATGQRHWLTFSDGFGSSWHRTRAADVVGTLTIEVDEQEWTVFDESAVVEFGLPDLLPQITRYSEIYFG